MARRGQVVCTRKDTEGVITHVGVRVAGNYEQYNVAEAVFQIKLGALELFVYVRGIGEVGVIVVSQHHGPDYLRTDPDRTKVNNLDELPPCQ
jgi:hypothetical protein